MGQRQVYLESDPLTSLAFVAFAGGDARERTASWNALARTDGPIRRSADVAWRRACARQGWDRGAWEGMASEFLDEAPACLTAHRADFVRLYRRALRDERLHGFFEWWALQVLTAEFRRKVHEHGGYRANRPPRAAPGMKPNTDPGTPPTGGPTASPPFLPAAPHPFHCCLVSHRPAARPAVCPQDASTAAPAAVAAVDTPDFSQPWLPLR